MEMSISCERGGIPAVFPVERKRKLSFSWALQPLPSPYPLRLPVAPVLPLVFQEVKTAVMLVIFVLPCGSCVTARATRSTFPGTAQGPPGSACPLASVGCAFRTRITSARVQVPSPNCCTVFFYSGLFPSAPKLPSVC